MSKMENRKKCFCYECRNVGFSENFGTCNTAGVTVNPYDGCPFGKKRDAAYMPEPPVIRAALVRISMHPLKGMETSVHKYCTVEDAMCVRDLEEGKPENAGCTFLIVDFTEEVSAALALRAAGREVRA